MRGAARRREAPTTNWNDFVEVTTKADLVIAWKWIVDDGQQRFNWCSKFLVCHSSECVNGIPLQHVHFVTSNAGRTIGFGCFDFSEDGGPQFVNCEA